MFPVVFACVLLTVCSSAQGEGADSPKCDPALVGDLKQYYPENKIPTDIIKTMRKNGPYSTVLMSAAPTLVFRDEMAICVGINVIDDSVVAITKKMAVGEIAMPYNTTEDSGMLSYKGLTDIDYKKKVYIVKFNGLMGLAIICSETGTGSSQNVALFVADRYKDNPTTLAAITKAKKFLKEKNLLDNTVDLKYCSTL